MPDWDDDSPDLPPSSEELCRQAFSRCSNWPEDRAGQIGLAQGLAAAARRFSISQEDIIAECRSASSFCPTDHDMLQVAGEIHKQRERVRKQAEQDRQRAEWERQYGRPKPFEKAEKCSCCERDWEEIIATHQSRHRELWNGLSAHFHHKSGPWPDYRDMAPVARRLGFPKIADAWERES